MQDFSIDMIYMRPCGPTVTRVTVLPFTSGVAAGQGCLSFRADTVPPGLREALFGPERVREPLFYINLVLSDTPIGRSPYPVSLEWAVAIVTFEILCVLGVLEVSL